MTGKGIALVVSAHVPSRSAEAAGQMTAYKHLFELAKDNEVDLVLLCKKSDFPLSPQQSKDIAELVRNLDTIPISTLDRFAGVILGSVNGLAPRFSSRLTYDAYTSVKRRLASTSYTLVWMEFSQVFWVLNLVAGKSYTVLSAHDLQTQLVATKSNLECVLTLGWTFSSEKRLLHLAKRISVLSSKDKSLLTDLFQLDPNHIDISPPALSGFIYSVCRSAAAIEPYSLLFWGAMGRPENSDAIIQFAKYSFAELLGLFPTAKLYVVGSNPTPAIRALESQSIVVTGFLEDPTHYFEKCSIGIAPLTSGAGIKIKVLEMLQAKMPVISSLVGAEGIETNSLLTVVPVECFNSAIANLWGKRR